VQETAVPASHAAYISFLTEGQAAFRIKKNYKKTPQNKLEGRPWALAKYFIRKKTGLACVLLKISQRTNLSGYIYIVRSIQEHNYSSHSLRRPDTSQFQPRS